MASHRRHQKCGCWPRLQELAVRHGEAVGQPAVLAQPPDSLEDPCELARRAGPSPLAGRRVSSKVMRPMVTVRRIQPAVSRFTSSQPTKLQAAISQTMVRSLDRRFTGGTALAGHKITQDPCRHPDAHKARPPVRISSASCTAATRCVNLYSHSRKRARYPRCEGARPGPASLRSGIMD